MASLRDRVRLGIRLAFVFVMTVVITVTILFWWVVFYVAHTLSFRRMDWESFALILIDRGTQIYKWVGRKEASEVSREIDDLLRYVYGYVPQKVNEPTGGHTHCCRADVEIDLPYPGSVGTCEECRAIYVLAVSPDGALGVVRVASGMKKA